MDLDDGAVHRHRLELDAHDLLSLQVFEHLVQTPFFDQRFIRV